VSPHCRDALRARAMSNSHSSSSPPGIAVRRTASLRSPMTRWSMLTCSYVSSGRLNQRIRRMDCRIKSGNDEVRKNENERKIREAERRQTQCFMSRTQAACGSRHGDSGLRRPPLAGALACRRSTTVLAAATERHRSAPVHALPGTERDRSGCYPFPAAPVQRVAPQTGRSAGRAFWPGAARKRR
jgi:hypothetical protein